jgi:hypothetical protein
MEPTNGCGSALKINSETTLVCAVARPRVASVTNVLKLIVAGREIAEFNLKTEIVSFRWMKKILPVFEIRSPIQGPSGQTNPGRNSVS